MKLVSTRIELPRHFLEQGRGHLVLELFGKPAYKETFHGVEYLHALALIRRQSHNLSQGRQTVRRKSSRHLQTSS